MKEIDINCDMGEGTGNESEIMPYIQSCNIACGGHTGDQLSMSNTIKLALENKVKIGAHPSYPDRENFGRTTLNISPSKLKSSIQTQMESLIEELHKQNGVLHHIKPHGALYNDVAANEELANHFLKIIAPYKYAILYVPFGSVIAKLALKQHFNIVYEAFADRNYNDDLSLVSRKKEHAIITNTDHVLNHIKNIYYNQKVTCLSGNEKYIEAATFCVHSDTTNAELIVKTINRHLTKINED